jgi:hypothetical protein
MREELHTFNKKLLTLFRKKYGKGSQSDATINAMGKEYIGSKFKGVYPWDTMPTLPSNSYAVINTDSHTGKGIHWVGVYSKNNTYYLFDSFGRQPKNILHPFVEKQQKLGKGIVNLNKTVDQANKQEDCGLRSIAMLIIAKKHGINSVFD